MKNIFLPEGQLDNGEIKKRLEEFPYKNNYHPSEELIADILDKFWFHDFYNSFIAQPKFLELLIEYLDEVRLQTFSRFDYYEFIFRKLLFNGIKVLSSEQAKVFSTLQIIGLSFENAQTSRLAIEKYNDFLNHFNFPQNLFGVDALTQIQLAKRINEKGIEYIEWSHHSLTEYLAAASILESKDPISEAKKYLILEKEGIASFKPSWYGTLRFLFDSKEELNFVQWALSFATEHPDVIDEYFSDILTSVNTELLPDKAKSQIFTLIYRTYFNRQIWLPVWTQRYLTKFCNASHLQEFRVDIKITNDVTETFVHRGNIAGILNHLLEGNNSLLTNEEKDFWKAKLIEFAKDKNPNGVLQRFSLAALSHYHDVNIISEVQENFTDDKDSLVKEEFIQFCYATDPNAEITIDYLIKGVKNDISIYSRHGIWQITSKHALKYFLEKISNDEQFLKEFIHDDSIFNSDGKHADDDFFMHLRKYPENDVVNAAKEVIKNVFSVKDIYHEERSYFLEQLALFIQENEPNFIFEILEEIIKYKDDEDKSWKLLYDYQALFEVLLTKEKVRPFFEKLNIFGERGKRIGEWVTYQIRNSREKEGKIIFEEALSNKLIHPPQQPTSSPEEIQKERAEKEYEEFKKLLEPAPKKYFPTVFEYYLKYKDSINKNWTQQEKDRFISLALTESLEKIDPKEMRVKYASKEKKGQYNISAVANYYGDLLRIGQIFFQKELQRFRQNIINFIPLAYSSDQKTILEIVKTVTDEELSFVNSIYLNEEDDRRYLLPDSYTYLVGEFKKTNSKLSSPKKVLLEFIQGPFAEYEKEYALEQLGSFITKDDQEIKSFLQKLFENKNASTHATKLGELANISLIRIYNDEEAINWRFNELKERKKSVPKRESGQVYTPTDAEMEISGRAFAKPLVDLSNEKYLEKFLEIVDFSFDLLNQKGGEDYLAYAYYLWQVSIDFVSSLKIQGSFKPLITFETALKKYEGRPYANWLFARIIELRKDYVNTIGLITEEVTKE